MALIIDNIAKQFGDFPALHGVSLEGQPGEFLALLGPSGSGKTTLLRILAGLEFPDSGTLTFDDADLLSQPARERRIGMVFQHYALFRHMTVAQNIAFGLTVRAQKDRPRRAVIDARVTELLRLVQLTDLGKRFPNQLSGGQRQRVALARALAIEPRMLLLDEPFGALDAKVRKELRRWLREVHEQTGVTTVFVTHDQEEALDLADRVVVLNKGRIEQIGRPQEVYAAPASAFVYEFLGNTNRFEGAVKGAQFIIDGVTVPFEGAGVSEGQGIGYARPHDLVVTNDASGIPLTVTGVFAAGPAVRLETRRDSNGSFVEIQLPPGELSANLARGAAIRVRPSKLRVFPKS